MSLVAPQSKTVTLSAAKIKNLDPVTKTIDGKLFLVGYSKRRPARPGGAKPRAQKVDYELEVPKRCEIRGRQLFMVKEERQVEETLHHCSKCGWNGYAEHKGEAQKAHDTRADELRYICMANVRPVKANAKLREVDTSTLPPLHEGGTNMGWEEKYAKPGSKGAKKGVGKKSKGANRSPIKPDKVRNLETRGWVLDGGKWTDPRTGKTHNLADAFKLCIERGDKIVIRDKPLNPDSKPHETIVIDSLPDGVRADDVPHIQRGITDGASDAPTAAAPAK